MGTAELVHFIRLNLGCSALPYVHPQTSSHLQTYLQLHDSKTPVKSTFRFTLWLADTLCGGPALICISVPPNLRYPLVGLHLFGPYKFLKTVRMFCYWLEFFQGVFRKSDKNRTAEITDWKQPILETTTTPIRLRYLSIYLRNFYRYVGN